MPLIARKRWFASGACLLLAVLFGSAGSATAATPNDDFSNRQSLGPTLPISQAATNIGAGLEAGEPSHPGFVPAGHSIWFAWEASESELVTVGTCGSDLATILSVYVGETLSELTEVASNRFSAGPTLCLGSQITFRASAGTEYQLQIDGNAFQASGQPVPSGEGEIELQIESQGPPANDDFADAISIPAAGTGFTIDAANWGATSEAGEPIHRGKGGGSSIWFKWTPARSQGGFIQACRGPDNQTVVAVYTGATVSGLAPVPFIQGNGNEPDCYYTFAATAGVTYWIAIDGKPSALTGAGAMANPSLYLSTFPGNDDFEASTDLSWKVDEPSALPARFNFIVFGFRNQAATKQAGEPHHAGNSGGASVWFTWTAPMTGSVHFGTCDASFRTLLAVYTGTALQALRPIAASDNPLGSRCDFNEDPGEVAFNIDAGTTYRIAIDGFDGAMGTFGLETRISSERLPPSAVAPNTRIAKRRIWPRRGFARFRLGSNDADATFRCKLDSRRFTACGARVQYGNLRSGWHTFRAEAVSVAGLIDPSPAIVRFKIRRKPSQGTAVNKGRSDR